MQQGRHMVKGGGFSIHDTITPGKALYKKKSGRKSALFSIHIFLSQQAFFAAVVDAVLRDLGDQRPVQAPEEGQRYRQRG